MTQKIKINNEEVVIMSPEERFWNDVVEARTIDIETSEKNIKYNKAIVDMAKQKLKEGKWKK